MPHRLSAPRDPVELWHDGERVVAERGEPIAFALLAADRLPLARSPKLHRPRAPYCMRGACDGCLARVDGVPNVMTCRRPAAGGERVETQNVLGTRGVDVLRATDFLFPRGIDHHRLLAGITGVSAVVQSFARRVAGLGRLPAEPAAPSAARRLEISALVVGGGAAGLAAAAAIGSRALLVDDGLALGGSLALLEPPSARDAIERARKAGAELLTSTTAIGLYRRPDTERIHALLAGPEGVTLAIADAVLAATGSHDRVLAFAGNDLPGVMSARAALALLRGGVALAPRIVLLGEGRFASAISSLAPRAIAERIAGPELVRTTGRSKLRGVVVRDGSRDRRIRAGALLVDGPGAPAFELAAQAGAELGFDPARGYVPQRDAEGRAAAQLWCAGSAAAAGVSSSEDGHRIGLALREWLTHRLDPLDVMADS